MQISIINGSGKGDSNLDRQAEKLRDQLALDHSVRYFPIKNMNMVHCQGCWDCWTKTPGLCRMKDDGMEYLKSLASSDMMLILSPVRAGFLTAETKKAMDRYIPNSLCHIGIYEKECHHFRRYPQEMMLALYLMDDGKIDKEAEDIIFENMKRVQLNMRTKTLLTGRLNNNIEEIVNEISNC